MTMGTRSFLMHDFFEFYDGTVNLSDAELGCGEKACRLALLKGRLLDGGVLVLSFRIVCVLAPNF